MYIAEFITATVMTIVAVGMMTAAVLPPIMYWFGN
jgi:hypothetical protein